MPDELAVIRIFHYRHEAELARSALTADGIDSTLMADDAGSQGLGIQFVRGVKLLVREEDRDRAEEILGGGGALTDEPAEE